MDGLRDRENQKEQGRNTSVGVARQGICNKTGHSKGEDGERRTSDRRTMPVDGGELSWSQPCLLWAVWMPWHGLAGLLVLIPNRSRRSGKS